MRLKYQFELIRAIRLFFEKNGFLETPTPPIVENPGMETHIHPFQIKSAYKNIDHDLYLHTSPEFWMKHLLAETDEKLENIYNLSYCFRDEPESPLHRSQFLMLEWYRKHKRYETIMDDCEKLIQHCSLHLHKEGVPIKDKFLKIDFYRKTVQELFLEVLNIDILEFLETQELKKLIQKDFKGVPLPDSECSFDDYFFLLFLNEVEPVLSDYNYLLLKEYPHQLAALSTLKESDPRVCERFEIYLNGVELCNCFNELTDLKLQKARFLKQALEKSKLYNYQLPQPNVLYNALERGLPASSGIAMGVERLLLGLTKISNPFFN
jgi:lysyl-tRNA synthetase class 2